MYTHVCTQAICQQSCLQLHSSAVGYPVSQVAVSADGMNVLATLLVIGSMDTARSDILGNGNVKQSSVEQFSQVRRLLHLCW